MNRMTARETSAATFGLSPVACRRRRYNGLNTIARTVPHRIAPLNGHKTQKNATVTAITSSKKVLSSRLRIAIPRTPSSRDLTAATRSNRSRSLNDGRVAGDTAFRTRQSWPVGTHRFRARSVTASGGSGGTCICALHKTHADHKPGILYVRQPAAPGAPRPRSGEGRAAQSDRSWVSMSLLTWDKPRTRNSRGSALCRGAAAPGPAS